MQAKISERRNLCGNIRRCKKIGECSITNKDQTDLSAPLKRILDLELSLGNAVARTDCGAWSETPLVVVMKERLHHEAIKALKLPETVTYWENRDSHYDIESGYSCAATKHCISGPL